MKITLSILSVCLLAAGAAQAALVDLGIAADGNYANGSVITNTTSFGGATFDILYTLGSTGNTGTVAYTSTVESDGSKMGVRSGADGTGGQTWKQYSTIEGNDNEGISFSSLSIANFNAGTSEYVIGDIENLTFSAIDVSVAGAAADSANVSFTSFGNVDAVFANLAQGATGVTNTIDLTSLATYSSAETAVYLEPDDNNSSNRWSIDNIQVSYTIPEPATLGLVASCAFGVLFIRRRFMM